MNEMVVHFRGRTYVVRSEQDIERLWRFITRRQAA